MKGILRPVSFVIAAAVMIAALPKVTGAKAPDTGKSESNTSLGTLCISNPQKPEDKDSPWTGDYVWFGSYEGKPIKFRVLAKDSTAYTEKEALFLDCDRSLFNEQFNNAPPFSNMWDGSHIQKVLNEDFYQGFDKVEQDAVAISKGFGGPEYYEPEAGLGMFGSPVSVNDRIILLDARDVVTEEYGYYPATGLSDGNWFMVPNHIKEGGTKNLWNLRSAYLEANNNHLACVHEYGEVLNNANCYSRGDGNIGVAPALNVDQGAVIFSSSVGKSGNEFKLTVKNADITVAIPEGEGICVKGNKVTIPYSIGGADSSKVNRISVLILDKEYLDGTANDAKIISYRSLGSPKGKTGTFTLPEGYALEGWGKDYFVYILAEDINGEYETDYASVPVMVNAPGSEVPSCPANTPTPTAAVTPHVIKDMSNTDLGTSAIHNPARPSDAGTPWTGDCIYFGTYDGKPIKFRVLAKDSTCQTSDKALFLDSEEVLFNDYYDNTEPLSNSWKDSDIRSVLNGKFLDGFTSLEKDSIAESTGAGNRDYEDLLTFHFGSPVSVEDRVFLLDAADITNEDYGYSSNCGRNVIMQFEEVWNHKKNGSFNYWWLRSGSVEDKSHYFWRNRKSETDVGEVYPDGSMASYCVNTLLGVSPAMNIDQKSIIFTSAIEDTKDQYKLTLIDKDLAAKIPEGRKVSIEGKTVTVPYEVSPDADRVSVLILDKEFSEGNPDDAKIMYYNTLGDPTGTEGTFEIPEGSVAEGWGTEYFVYILSEKINGGCSTDYSSIPFKIEPPFEKAPAPADADPSEDIPSEDGGTTDTALLVTTLALVAVAGSSAAVAASKKKGKQKNNEG